MERWSSAAELLIDLVSINTEDEAQAAEDKRRIVSLAQAFAEHQAKAVASLPRVPLELRRQSAARTQPADASASGTGSGGKYDDGDVTTAAALPSVSPAPDAAAASPTTGLAARPNAIRRSRSQLRTFGYLFKRSCLMNVRDVRTNLLRFGSTVGLAFIFKAQFGALDSGGPPTAKSVTTRVALLRWEMPIPRRHSSLACLSF